MSLTLLSYPRYIFAQASAPTSAAIGNIWVDTDASPITTYVYNGSSWLSLSTDVDWVADLLAQMSVNILINSVAASSTLNDYDKIFVDDFTDSDGTCGTIDTTNSTAYFSTGQYSNTITMKDTFDRANSATLGDAEVGGTWSETEPNGAITIDTNECKNHITGSSVQYASNTFTAASPTELTFKFKNSNVSGGLGGYVIFYDGATEILSVNIGSSANQIGYNDGSQHDIMACSAATWYKITLKNINWTAHTYDIYVDDVLKQSSAAFKNNQSSMSVIKLSAGGSGATYDVYYNDVYIYGSAGDSADLIIQTNTITIPSGITNHQLYCKNTTAGSASITYDFSADGGSTWDTDQALNNKNSFGATTGTSCIIKINLNGTGAGDIAIANNYGIIIYT